MTLSGELPYITMGLTIAAGQPPYQAVSIMMSVRFQVFVSAKALVLEEAAAAGCLRTPCTCAAPQSVLADYICRHRTPKAV